LLDRLDELTAVSQCLESEHTFALAGWLPERRLDEIERVLDANFEGRAVVERLAVSRADWMDVPVLVENVPALRPFELLLRLLPPPRYGTIEPTLFVAFFFPLFFGLILGDIGYGALLLLVALWAERRQGMPPWARDGARVLRPAAVAAILFGLAFGELFGDLGQGMGLRPLVVDRAHAILPLLLLSIGIGAVQVSLGLALGVVNSYLQRQQREALSRLATLLGLVGAFFLVAVVADLLPRQLLHPSLVLLAIVVVVLIFSVGIVGPLEVVGVLASVLSYARLAAVGLASMMLAVVANQLAGMTGSVLLGIILGTLLHALNLALGLFSPFVQSLRLQYVEFFGRFYQPGGRPYRPFSARSMLGSRPG
jgi:V/A-type H+-transporting ATPase subunit I